MTRQSSAPIRLVNFLIMAYKKLVFTWLAIACFSLAGVVKILVALSILFTYGLQFTVPSEIIWKKVSYKIQPEAHEKAYYMMRGVMIVGTGNKTSFKYPTFNSYSYFHNIKVLLCNNRNILSTLIYNIFHVGCGVVGSVSDMSLIPLHLVRIQADQRFPPVLGMLVTTDPAVSRCKTPK